MYLCYYTSSIEEDGTSDLNKLKKEVLESNFLELFKNRTVIIEEVKEVELYSYDSNIYCYVMVAHNGNENMKYAYEYKQDGSLTKAVTFTIDNKFYTVRCEDNNRIIKYNILDPLFRYRQDEYRKNGVLSGNQGFSE